MSKNDGGSAFPVPTDVNPDGLTSGMTLRDYFANTSMRHFTRNLGTSSDQQWFDAVAEASYKMADAMLAERIKDAKAE